MSHEDNLEMLEVIMNSHKLIRYREAMDIMLEIVMWKDIIYYDAFLLGWEKLLYIEYADE